MSTRPAARIKSPTAIVSYSHGNPGWTTEQQDDRQQQVARFVAGLRSSGIDADADLFHPNEDWTRWGPRKVDDSDFVLIVASQAWKHAWSGTGDELVHRGARAEASAVRSIEHRGATEFQRRCRIIMLPGSTEEDIPVGMHGLGRHQIKAFDLAGLEPLVRDLTDQPKFVAPTLGPVPILPPAMTTHTPDVEGLMDPRSAPGVADSTAVVGSRDQQQRINQFRSQLAALPAPLPGEGPHLPWFRLRQTIEGLLAAELSSPKGVDSAAGSTSTIRWLPAANIAIAWVDQWHQGPANRDAAVALHLLPDPATPVSQRLLLGLQDAATRLVRTSDLINASAGMRTSVQENDVTVETDGAHRRYDDVSMGAFLGLRVHRSGQLSVWYSLPTDRMGSVLDLHHLERDLEQALGVGAALLDAGLGKNIERVAVAAELINTNLLTDGRITQLGNRNAATMPGFHRTARMEPEESVDTRNLQPPSSQAIAATVAEVLIRSWTR